MEFGLQFFPVVGPEDKPADQYWAECLHLTELADQLGYTCSDSRASLSKVRRLLSSPHIFLTAASMKTKKMRLVSGAVQPVFFNNPLKIAGEIGMLMPFLVAGWNADLRVFAC